MESIVLPQVDIDTRLRDALQAMKDADRSAVVTTDEDGDTWIFDLPTILKGIRRKRATLADTRGGTQVVDGGDPRVARAIIARALAAMTGGFGRIDADRYIRDHFQSMLQESLELAGLQFLQFSNDGKVDPVTSEKTQNVGPIELVLPLNPGAHNPTAMSSANITLSSGGAFTGAIRYTSAAAGTSLQHRVLAARFTELAQDLCNSPNWCTCNLDEDHMFPHSDHSNGDDCPQHDGGTLNCS